MPLPGPLTVVGPQCELCPGHQEVRGGGEGARGEEPADLLATRSGGGGGGYERGNHDDSLLCRCTEVQMHAANISKYTGHQAEIRSPHAQCRRALPLPLPQGQRRARHHRALHRTERPRELVPRPDPRGGGPRAPGPVLERPGGPLEVAGRGEGAGSEGGEPLAGGGGGGGAGEVQGGQEKEGVGEAPALVGGERESEVP